MEEKHLPTQKRTALPSQLCRFGTADTSITTSVGRATLISPKSIPAEGVFLSALSSDHFSCKSKPAQMHPTHRP